ncbi:MAG: Xaa-Pro dipeptidase [Pseudomonadota bacterium]
MSPEHQVHLQQLISLYQEALSRSGHDAVMVAAGPARDHFRDDQGPRFKPNAYFSHWVAPEFAQPGALLLVGGTTRPKLLLQSSDDYWHAPPPIPEHLETVLDLEVCSSADALLTRANQLTGTHNRVAFIGEHSGNNEALGEDNPPALLNFLDWHRAQKTPFELELMREASRLGALGHQAAACSFFAGESEFAIHCAYLAASMQNESALPYGNIVALNTHGAYLHYEHQERSVPNPHLSLLIDAGAEYQGYVSDITRTYVHDQPDHQAFADLIAAMRTLQDNVIAEVAPERMFPDLQSYMHEQLADVLTASGVLQCSREEAYEEGYTRKFCPHGLGHLLGLQVHDLGGHLKNAQGEVQPPSPLHPSLRFTREITPEMVFTIEPGLYFIDSLLAELKAEAAPVNWDLVEFLRPYGGVRIEDNVRVLADGGVENLTRDAFAAVEAAG